VQKGAHDVRADEACAGVSSCVAGQAKLTHQCRR
jgi:hypothetical protein